MKRWVVPILVLMLGATAGGAGWRAYQLDAELDETQDETETLRRELDAMGSTVAGRDEQLEESARRLKALNRELKEMRGKLGDRQLCPNYPRLILSPKSGPPGTRVEFVGYCFVSDYAGYDLAQDSGYGLFVINPAQDVSDPDYVSNGGPDCELIAGTEPHELIVRPNGTARGYLTIPSSGGCFQTDREELVSPGQYDIGLGCHACGPLATFRVTS